MLQAKGVLGAREGKSASFPSSLKFASAIDLTDIGGSFRAVAEVL